MVKVVHRGHSTRNWRRSSTQHTSLTPYPQIGQRAGTGGSAFISGPMLRAAPFGPSEGSKRAAEDSVETFLPPSGTVFIAIAANRVGIRIAQL